jgi:hypothetical protein
MLIFEDDILYTDITLFEKEKKNYKRIDGTIEQFYYSKDDLKAILKDIGFIIEDIKTINLHNFDKDDKDIYICKRS